MDGIIIVNKETNMTSHDVVNQLRHCLKIKRIGHSGTLDPLATGVLVVCVGQATKLMPYLVADDKEYIGKIAMGLSTTTDDITGTPIEEVHLTEVDLTSLDLAMKQFIGNIEQIPPQFSAIKIAGKKAYDYARKGQNIELKARPITVTDFCRTSEAVFHDSLWSFNFQASVSKGTYVRSLVRDLGKTVGIPCTLASLMRTRVGRWTIDQASTLTEISEGHFQLISPLEALSNYCQIELTPELHKPITNGVGIPTELLQTTADTIVFKEEGRLVAIYGRKGSYFVCERGWSYAE